jgi:hypothetical protein
MRYLIYLIAGITLWVTVSCTVSHRIEETEPPPDQPPLNELDGSSRQHTDMPGETTGGPVA